MWIVSVSGQVEYKDSNNTPCPAGVFKGSTGITYSSTQVGMQVW